MKPLRLPLISSFTRRTYASAARPKKNLDGKGPVLTLEHFLQKKKALNLWREIVRALNSTKSMNINYEAFLKSIALVEIPTSSTRDELRLFARAEFERQKDVTDIQHVRYLISSGKTQFDSMKRYIEEQAR